MHSIREKCGAAIDREVMSTGIDPAFLAALIANESGGDSTKKRFEKNVLLQIWEVLQGRTAHFGSIGGQDLYDFAVYASTANPTTNRWIVSACHAIDALATS